MPLVFFLLGKWLYESACRANAKHFHGYSLQNRLFYLHGGAVFVVDESNWSHGCLNLAEGEGYDLKIHCYFFFFFFYVVILEDKKLKLIPQTFTVYIYISSAFCTHQKV